MNDTLYTIREASRDYFQSNVIRKEITLLFHAGCCPASESDEVGRGNSFSTSPVWTPTDNTPVTNNLKGSDR